MAAVRASRRSTRTDTVSYREPSSSPEIDEDDVYLPDPSPEPPAKKRKTSLPQRLARPSPSKPQRARRSRPTTRETTISPTKRAQPKPLPARSIPSDGVVPDWSSLPYEILLSVFRYASEPLRDELLVRPKLSINWLLNTSRVCSAFKEPALTALYESPPLFELNGPHDLLSLLKADPSAWSLPYNAKIKRLELDANRTLAYTAPGRGLIDVADLICHMPLVSDVAIRDNTDQPPYRMLHRGKGFMYRPEDLFEKLSANGTQLSRWHWNAHLVKQLSSNDGFPQHCADILKAAHQTSALAQLTELSLSQFASNTGRRSPKLGEAGADDDHSQELADRMRQVLAPLKRLRALSLTACGAFEKAWPAVLQALPTELEAVNISNTQFLTSTTITDFLASHGRNLRSLVLDHNQSLDLSFTVGLKESCPRLERLHMDVTFYNQIASYEDKGPLFDALLITDEIPTWPSSLQSLELYNLRQWESDAAENFFMSLIDSSQGLPHLRRLVLKAILNISWRDRAGFRETWIGRLQHVFLRTSDDPDPSLASKRAFRESEGAPTASSADQANAAEVEGNANQPEVGSSMGARARRSQRIKTHEAEKAQEKQHSPDTDGSVEELPRGHFKLPVNTYVQGMCDIVDVSIDNNRPSEVQYNEKDFLDSDPGEDDEWVEDVPTSEPVYAW